MRGVVWITMAPLLAALAPGQEPRPAERMPLRIGYYVSSDTPCAAASRATVMLFKGDGFGLNCETRSLEQLGASRYRLSDICTDNQGGGVIEGTTEYELSGDTGFTVRGEDGSAWSARFCRQSQMPEPFRSNDISWVGR